MRRPSGRGLEEPEFQFGFFRHVLFAPWWIEGELYVTVENIRKFFDLLLYVADDVACCGACGCGECHNDLDVAFVADLDIVYETEVEDIDGDLGVEDGAQRGFDSIAKHGLSYGWLV